MNGLTETLQATVAAVQLFAEFLFAFGLFTAGVAVAGNAVLRRLAK